MSNLAERNKSLVKAFFKAIESESAEDIANMFSEKGVHINPYHSDLFPKGARGREEIKNYWAPTFGNFDGMSFPINEIYSMEGDDKVFVNYSGRIKLKNDAGWYENDYYSVFYFNDNGEIVEYIEIFNPITAARGFNMLDKLTS